LANCTEKSDVTRTPPVRGPSVRTPRGRSHAARQYPQDGIEKATSAEPPAPRRHAQNAPREAVRRDRACRPLRVLVLIFGGCGAIMPHLRAIRPEPFSGVRFRDHAVQDAAVEDAAVEDARGGMLPHAASGTITL